MIRYGELPTSLGQIEVNCDEMMFYQYLPIKIGDVVAIEDRLKPFHFLIQTAINDFSNTYGLGAYKESYIYLTVKNTFVMPYCHHNRPGYHSDGFMTDDVNYIWSNRFPTIFNTTEFNLSMDEYDSILEMEQQALVENEVVFPNKTLLRLDQFNIHKVGDVTSTRMRLFVKISFSRDKYDLIGNSHNHLIPYDWEMSPRLPHDRNIPQSVKV